MNDDDSFRESARVESTCHNEIQRLRRWVSVGDITAALALQSIATVATEALHSLWTDPTPRLISSKKGESGDLSLEARREMLTYFLGDADLPVMFRRNTRKVDRDQIRMAKERGSWPLKPRGRKDSDMKALLEMMIMPRFQEIQIEEKQPPTGIDRQIWRLPQLSRKTMKEWADVVVRFLVEAKGKQLFAPESRLYGLANPERELATEKKRRARVLDRYVAKTRAKWRAEPDSDREPVRKTKLEHEIVRRRNETALLKVTDAHVKAGLRAAILRYWKSNLAV